MPQPVSSGHEEVWPCAAQLLLWQSVPGPALSIRSECCSPSCPHGLTPITLTEQEVSLMLLKMTISQFNLWLNYSKKQRGTYIRDGSDKERGDPFHTGQINLKRWKKTLHHLMFLPYKLIKCGSELIACMRAPRKPDPKLKAPCYQQDRCLPLPLVFSSNRQSDD